jgi:hypothetical protein
MDARRDARRHRPSRRKVFAVPPIEHLMVKCHNSEAEPPPARGAPKLVTAKTCIVNRAT